MDIFKWRTQLQDKAESAYTQNIREAQFGDGYKQVAGVGINIETESWALSWTSDKKTSLEINEFLRSHIISAFQWENPLGEIALYRVSKDSIKYSPLSYNAATVSGTFERVHSV